MNGLKHYLASFDAFIKNTARFEPDWVGSLRRDALAHFSESGFPKQRLEEWKYTNVSPIAQVPFQPAQGLPPDFPADQIEQVTLPESRDARLVFVNGVFHKALSSVRRVPAPVVVANIVDAFKREPERVREYLAQLAPTRHNGFTALNTAFHRDGAFIYIPADTSVQTPIELVFISFSKDKSIMAQPRNLIVAGKHSSAAVVETYLSFSGESFATNAVTEVHVAEGAALDHYQVQEEDGRSYHIALTQVTQEHSSTYRSFVFEVGSALARNSLNVVLQGEAASCQLAGLHLASGAQHLDSQTVIHHAKPHTASRQIYKGILDGKSTCVFNGKIVVERDAQKTDAQQSSKHLVLSDEASADARPQLEIFADDVKCAHGAAIGQLDEEALFYLKSRGIGFRQAQSLLTAGFASEVTDLIALKSLRARLARVPRIKFSAVMPGGA